MYAIAFSSLLSASSSSVVDGVTAIDGIFAGMEYFRGLCDAAGIGAGRNCT